MYSSDQANALLDVYDHLPQLNAAFDQQLAFESDEHSDDDIACDPTWNTACDQLTELVEAAQEVGCIANDIERLLIRYSPEAILKRIFLSKS